MPLRLYNYNEATELYYKTMSNLSKFEKVVTVQLLTHLAEHQLPYHDPFGFRPQQSTEIANCVLLEITDIRQGQEGDNIKMC